MLKNIINRPVTATVVAFLMVILGVLAMIKLPMETFPEIAPPSVVVSARYPGANSETVARSVATPLEQAINGVENMMYMTSSSSNDGNLNITIFFKLGTNPDQAAVNVQNRVAQVTSQLPKEVINNGISTAKQNNSMIMIIDFESTNPKYDATFLNNYDLINIVPYIQRIPGVGKAQVFGSKDYAMRVWLDPSKMANANIDSKEILAAIDNQNIEAAPGKLGEGGDLSFEYSIKYEGKFNDVEQYKNIVVRANADGSILKLGDVAKVELGSLDHSFATAQTLNGNPGTGVAIFQTPGSNANEIQIEILKFMAKAEKSFPEGIKYYIAYSTKTFLDASISQVKSTLIEAFILVFLVVFIFLQDFRSTLIPAIAVPVSIIGTFFFMSIFGFTINLLTLFAMVLAIGIVVDDAIVVVEAVHSKLHGHRQNPKSATISAMSEITGPILSITLIMSAVFLPIGLIEGPVGVFYKQFAFTLAIAIALSAVNALTLSPALCAILLKHPQHDAEGQKKGLQKFFYLFNVGFDAATAKYKKIVYFLIKRKWLAIGGLAIASVAAVFLAKNTPKAFIPTEDQSLVMTAFSLSPGTSLQRTKEVTAKLSEKLGKIDGMYYNAMVNGNNLLAGTASPSYAASYSILKQPKERKHNHDINVIMDSIRYHFDQLPEGKSLTFSMPTVPGFGNVDALDVVIKDNTGGDIQKFAKITDDFLKTLGERKEIASAFTSYNAKFPQFMLDVDAAKAKQLGLDVKDIMSTMQAYFGGTFTSDFNRFGKYYRVVVQAESTYRQDEKSLKEVFAKNNVGKMVPLQSVVSLRPVLGPEQVTHLNQATSINLNVQAAKGYSSGDAMNAINEVAEKLPSGFSHEYIGMAKEESESGNQTIVVFILCIVFVYFLLSAQYESYILPFSVILSLPPGILGVFGFINMMGVTNNIYVQIGMIMLIGLLAKNAILIVEFALQRRQSGRSLVEAAMQGAASRLRPILMTSFAFIAGLLPLLFSGGATKQGNLSIASSTIGGMFVGVMLGIFVIPVLFVIFQFLHEKLFGLKHKEDNKTVIEHA